MKLNELTPGLAEKLAPTDSRLRPDQRATENGEYDLVTFRPPRTHHLHFVRLFWTPHQACILIDAQRLLLCTACYCIIVAAKA